jgi:hypothetical protein
MKSKQSSRNQMSYWQLIFSQSKVNGAPYSDDELPVCNWSWPTSTYLQRRRSLNESLIFGPTDSQLVSATMQGFRAKVTMTGKRKYSDSMDGRARLRSASKFDNDSRAARAV